VREEDSKRKEKEKEESLFTAKGLFKTNAMNEDDLKNNLFFETKFAPCIQS
jgi:hypothetical protein